jgi:hypothetical protein
MNPNTCRAGLSYQGRTESGNSLIRPGLDHYEVAHEACYDREDSQTKNFQVKLLIDRENYRPGCEHRQSGAESVSRASESWVQGIKDIR